MSGAAWSTCLDRLFPKKIRITSKTFYACFSGAMKITCWTPLCCILMFVKRWSREKRQAVVSNKMRRLTVAVLRGLGVEKFFDMILGGDSAPEKKPAPALLHRALARFAVPAERALMIGDGDIDIEAGKQAGVVTCGVTYGLGREEDIIAAAPDFIIDSLSELARHIC